MNKSLALHQCILYYKERRQLKTFLTQFGPVLPLTPDPPVRLCDDRKGGMTIKIAIWEAFMPKTYFLSPTPHLPTLHTHWAHFSFPIPIPVAAYPRLESVASKAATQSALGRCLASACMFARGTLYGGHVSRLPTLAMESVTNIKKGGPGLLVQLHAPASKLKKCKKK
jgi:hypothetical protein